MTEERRSPRQASRRWLFVGIALTGIASVAGLGAMLLKAMQMVGAGRALETYHSFWLVEFNWAGFLVLCAAIVFALVLAFFMRMKEHLQWRSLEKKYGPDDS